MHTANQPYNVLDGADKQVNGRPAEDLARLNRYAPVLRAYCAAGDPVCAGGNVVADHLNYFELYTDDASSWVVSKINGTPSLCPAGSETASPVASATATVSASSGALPSETKTSEGVPGYPTKSVDEPAYPTKSADAPAYPSSTSPATPSAFPEPVEYESCVVVCDVEYVYV